MNNGESDRLQRYHATMLAEFAEECGDGTAHDVLRATSQTALNRVGGADAASVTTTTPTGFSTAVSTGPLAETADRTLYAAGRGPALETLTTGAPCCLTDTHRAAKWPELQSRLARQDVLSALSVSLGSATVDGTTVVRASLNLYASSCGAFSATSILLASMLAAHAGPHWELACATTRAHNLATALEAQAHTGPAIGLLMARRSISHDEALELLRAVSQRTHRRVRDLAVDIIAGGDLPEDGARIPTSRRGQRPAEIPGSTRRV